MANREAARTNKDGWVLTHIHFTIREWFLNYQEFEKWLEKLSETDRTYLARQTGWKKEYLKAGEQQSLPAGFIEKTMELLEGGSESET